MDISGERGEHSAGADHATVDATQTFVRHRNLLFTVAYEMLGSAADAEDVLQETWLRWVKVDLTQVGDQRAYLVRITTRQALNRLRSLKRRRESYVGSWLPEPLLTAPEAAADGELAESVSMALMLVLETLTPTERAVFVLREAFGFGYDDIAAAVDKTPAAVHQIAHRARRHVEARRPRRTVTADQAQAAVAAFQQALETRDLRGLLDVLAPDVVAISDGGGIKQASPRPVVGADKVARFIVGGLTKHDVVLTVEATVVNAGPALALYVDGALDGVIVTHVADGHISGLYYVRNPQKLTHLDSETPLTLR
ncbi:RNA polymerase sigma-70 factor [Nocardia cyriacigeorgica]|jgi:RNA polymerase sigma-70 factor (TIGR02957 family)|uniref:RNA polymerase sigma-70 factor n=1 Tax=Nocardia cyriacigeorgica TaxID=135487 RepID=UPI000CE9ED3A|nr:RNA polymerase sigma-70 factor [Nocardia cyriacigeorgica]AVH23753.1 RNA polymerase subunit sigma-24 [Nocardia cyriacigeorgica]MBF6324038.1 RNA polymerase sigma-70 factor [Nocardia cyriacigeorgica]MBF6497922.1 RNA polymerase sigma-70 factor [Nocardia cyriacigeorgica]PPJ15018.1 RNA polymerase subunit sigma-24 [Nocardia cyriacigeorgica]